MISEKPGLDRATQRSGICWGTKSSTMRSVLGGHQGGIQHARYTKVQTKPKTPTPSHPHTTASSYTGKWHQSIDTTLPGRHSPPYPSSISSHAYTEVGQISTSTSLLLPPAGISHRSLHQYPSSSPSPGIASLRSVSPHCPVKMPGKCHGLDLRFLLVGNSPGDVASERGHRGRDGLFSERLFVSLCANTHGPSWQDTIRLGAVISP